MSSGFYLVSGLLYMNMGCEIMFVLANRMRAQNVDMKAIGSKILCDITCRMFKSSFIQSMLKPHIPLTIPSLYDAFSSIVNSSVMKLDKNSMQKLFYLILMTFKRQIFLLSSPLELYTLTLTHLQDVAELQKQTRQACQQIETAIDLFQKASSKYTYMHYLDLREQMLSMLETYRSKIVLFCESGSQDQSGCLVFKPRYTHNRKNLGLAQNHPAIQFPINNEWANVKNQQYNNYKKWRTGLGKDDYDNVRGSSKMLEIKSKTKLNLQQDNKEMVDILGIKNMNLNNFELNLDIFGPVTEQHQLQKIQSTKTSSIKTIETKAKSSLEQKINKQFDALKVNPKNGDNEDIDLLELMDS